MKKITLILILISMMLLTSCASLKPHRVTVSSQAGKYKTELVFDKKSEDILEDIKDVFANEGWDIKNITNTAGKQIKAYETDHRFWKAALYPGAMPDYLIYGKTSTSAFSFGSAFYIAISPLRLNESVVTYVVTSSQYFEQDKLDTYLSTLSYDLKAKNNVNIFK